jgi:SAM-dependent methyltransferase
MVINPPDDKCSGQGLSNILKDKENVVGLEIGCAQGNTSEFLLKSLPQLKLYGVDPYVDYIDWNGNDLKEMDNLFLRIMNRMQPYGERFKLIRKFSDDCIGDFENDFFDFIFVDGLHTYDQVKKDMENFYPKLKSGGLFSGHDYNNIEEVKVAVNEFAKNNELTQIHLTDYDVWYWWKP